MARFRVNILEGVFYGDAGNFSERLIIFDTSFSFLFFLACVTLNLIFKSIVQ